MMSFLWGVAFCLALTHCSLSSWSYERVPDALKMHGLPNSTPFSRRSTLAVVDMRHTIHQPYNTPSQLNTTRMESGSSGLRNARLTGRSMRESQTHPKDASSARTRPPSAGGQRWQLSTPEKDPPVREV